MDRYTDRQRQTDTERFIQIDIRTGRQIYRYINRWIDTYTERQRETDGQTGRKINIDRQTDRQIYIDT